MNYFSRKIFVVKQLKRLYREAELSDVFILCLKHAFFTETINIELKI